MKNVLIVSYCFPPINMIAAKRFGTMCRYFEANGYKPYVLTTAPIGDWGVNARMDLEIPINKKQIIQIGTHKTNETIKSFFGHCLIRLLRDYKYNSRTVDAISLGWYEKVKSNIDLVQLKDVDIIIGTYPVMGDLFVACYLSRKLKCPYIADIRDLISDYSEIPEGYKRAKLLDSMIEKYVLHKARGIVTVTPGFKKVLEKRYPGKMFYVVFNGWDEVDKTSHPEKKEKYLYYAGSLYLHRLESFELLINCIEKINLETEKKIKLLIRSIGPDYLNAKLRRRVKQKGMQEYVSILPSADENTVRQEQGQAYINVVLNTIHESDRALMTMIPGKLYELLNNSIPILAITPRHSDVGKVLRYTNKGIASVSEQEIIDFILGKCGEYKGKNISFFTREKQAERFCSFMDKVLEYK